MPDTETRQRGPRDGQPQPADGRPDAPENQGPEGVDRETVAPEADIPHRARRRRVWLVVLGVVVLLLVLAGWLAWRGYQAYDALTRAESVATSVRGAISGADLESVEAVLPELRAATDQAVTATSDPVWRAAGVLPWLGPNTRAVTDVSTALDLLVDGVLDPLSDGGLDPSALLPVDGRFDVDLLRELAPRVQSAAEQATLAEDLLTAIEPEPLVAPLAERLSGLQEVLADSASGLRTAGDVLGVLPGIVGADGPRSYLVLVLNNAELRSGGGIVGAVAVVGADDGRLGLTSYAGSRDIDQWKEPVLPLLPGESDVHTNRIARYMQNVTMSPHFPRTAELATELWRRSSTSGEVDAVIAVDPVALSYVLEVTGPVPAPGVDLQRDNVVPELLADSYRRYPDPKDSDRFFAEAASSVFATLTAGRVDATALLSGLSRAAAEHRLSVWSQHAAEQRLLDGTSLAGDFFGETNSGAMGVFLNDVTAGKMDYYLRSEVALHDVVCAGDDVSGTVELVLRSDAPSDPAVLPEYVVGPLLTGLPAGVISTNVTVYAPVGGSITSIERGAAAIGGLQAVEAGRDVMVLRSVLAPGEQVRFAFDVRFPTGTDRLEIWTTPVIGTPGQLTEPVCKASNG